MMIYQLNVLTHAIHIHIFPDFISFSHTLSYSRTLSYPCTFLMFQAAVAFEGDNDRVKLMVLFSGEEDEGLVQAASGALAILSARKSICQKIISVSTTYTGEGGGRGSIVLCTLYRKLSKNISTFGFEISSISKAESHEYIFHQI